MEAPLSGVSRPASTLTDRSDQSPQATQLVASPTTAHASQTPFPQANCDYQPRQAQPADLTQPETRKLALASTAAITTSTGHTGRSASYNQTAAIRRRSMRLAAFAVAISSAD